MNLIYEQFRGLLTGVIAGGAYVVAWMAVVLPSVAFFVEQYLDVANNPSIRINLGMYQLGAFWVVAVASYLWYHLRRIAYRNNIHKIINSKNPYRIIDLNKKEQLDEVLDPVRVLLFWIALIAVVQLAVYQKIWWILAPAHPIIDLT